jgi:alcohol dehydrogenase (cytochrome c)
MPPSYDPELKLVIIGTSVTSPAPKFLLSGNDKKYLYHNCTLALDAQTGKIVWYYQHVVDHWDLDHTFERILLETAVAPDAKAVKWINPAIKPGEKRKVITGIPGKTGIVYTLDRRTGEFLWATPTIYQNVVSKIDGRTGEVTVEPSAMFNAKGDEATVCPSIQGGKNWPAGAYSPLTGTMYFPLQNTCSHYTVTIASRKEPSSYGLRAINSVAPGSQNVGSIHAISASTGRTEWKFEQRAAVLSLLTTGGGLLFGGDVAGRFRAFDQKTGQVLWQTNLGSQVTGFPVTYSIGDRQFIAVSVGQAVNTAGYLLITPEIHPSNNNSLYVFALPAGWQTARTTQRRQSPPAPTSVAAVANTSTAPPAATQCHRTDQKSRTARGSAGGTFSPAQAAQGKRLYVEQQCSLCHGENMLGSAGAPALADSGFRTAWQGQSLGELFECIRKTMPPGRAGQLQDADYARLVAAILEANGVPAGGADAALPADAGKLRGVGLDPSR